MIKRSNQIERNVGNSPKRRTRRAVNLGSLKGRGTEVDDDEVLQDIQRGATFSNQLEDPFKEQSLYTASGTSELRILPPPVNLAALLRMPNDNSILRQCIETMVINIEGHGQRMEYTGPDGGDQSDASKKEKEHIESFLETLHPEQSMTEIRKRVRWDMETLGFGYLEIGRTKEGMPIFISHIPAHTVRATSVDMDEVEVDVSEERFGKRVDAMVRRRFRRFIQILGTKKIWFKEFGDPRFVNPKDGKVTPNLAFEDTATEIVMFKQYYPGQFYGLPRWFNNLVAIQGSRQAELTNLDYFKENAIPAMAVLVSGGILTGDAIDQIEEHVTAARGRASHNRVLLLEVEGDENAAARDGVIPAPKVELKPLAGDKIDDGQFLEYDAAQIKKVRSSFRLPPIFTGHSEDYTRASAQTSYEVAEGQVFGPEREMIDDFVNRHLLAPYGVEYWEVRSNPPRISDPKEVIEAVSAFNSVGAMTPNVAIGLANEQFGLDVSLVEEEWGNYPFMIVQALATQGKLMGFDDIIKEIDDASGELGNNESNLVQPVADDDDDATKTDGGPRQVRHAIGNLRDVLELASKKRYDPPKRTRSNPENDDTTTDKAA